MSNTITYLDVPFSKKTEAKLYGALWDVENKRWYYIGENAGLNKFKIVYLDIPFKEKERAKSVGAKWDTEKKQWYSNQKNIQETHLKEFIAADKIYYDIPFDKKDGFKLVGGRWDADAGSWYAYKIISQYKSYIENDDDYC